MLKNKKNEYEEATLWTVRFRFRL